MTPKSFSAKAPSRREFLKLSAGTAAAAGLGLSLARGAHAAGDDVIKVGLIGCGGRGSGAAVNALNADPGARLVAMADLFEPYVKGSRDRIAKIHGDRVQVDDDHCLVGLDGYKGVIEASDVVLIACASKFHPQYLKEAIASGKHVFIEKPHAIDPPGIKVATAAYQEAEKKGLCVVSGLCWRYHTGVQETMKRVLDGAIGDVVTVQENYLRTPYRLVERQPEWDETEYQFRNWYHFCWLSGDDILQSLVHSFDKGAWALGDKPPVAAYGVGGRAASVGPVFGDVFDHNAIVFEYDNNVRLFGFGRAQNGCHNETSDHIFGTKGYCNVIKGQIEGENPWRYEGPNCNMYDAEHAALFSAIRDGKPINNGAYMINSTMIGILGTMVAYTGQRITWDDAIQSPWLAGPEEVSFDMKPPIVPDANGIYPIPTPGITRLG